MNLNKEIKTILERFDKIKSEIHDPRAISDHPDYEAAQSAMLDELKKLSTEDLISNVNEMTDEQLDDLSWNVEYLIDFNTDLYDFFDELATKRASSAIRYEVDLYDS